MMALPAVLVFRKSRLPLALLRIVALPAVLVAAKSQAAAVGDVGAAGRAGVEEAQGTVVGTVMLALPAVLVS